MTTNNHPAHGPVSLERLHQIREILSKAAAQSDGGNIGYAMDDAVKVIDGAIASFGSEPVLYAAEETLTYAKMGELHLKCLSQPMGDAVIPLYRHSQTAPVVPETLPCPVHLEPGLKFGKGVRTQCLLDALRRRADYYAELEAMTPEQRAEHDAGIAEFKAMIGNGGRGGMVDNDPQHTIQTAPTLDTDGKSAFPQHAMQSFGNSEQLDEVGSWNNHRNTPTAQAGNSPVTPDGYVLVPKELTAENGAKSVLTGEFSETKFINCPECFGDDECETCDGSGRIEITVPVSWTNIKAIWAKGVEHFEAAPQQENI